LITVTKNMAVTATFSRNVYSVGVTVLPSSAAGSVSGYVTTSIYHYDDSVQLTATPSTGYVFSGWTGDLTGLANPNTVTITGNMVITAIFTQSAYSVFVTALPAGGGSVTANPSAPYHYGDSVQLTATPSAGYVFSGWTGNLAGLANPATVTITGNTAVTAIFTQSAYSVSVTALPAGVDL